MKAVVDPILLSKELKKIAPVVGKNQVMPVLACVKLDFQKDKVVMTGTDLNTWVSYPVPCSCDQPFTILVELSDLIDICGKASGPVTVEPGEKIFKFKHDGGTIKVQVNAQPSEFCNIEDVEYLESVDVDGSFFHAIAGASACRGRDDLRPHLNKIGLDFTKNKLTVVGVDGFVMHKQTFPIKIKKNILISVGPIFAELTKGFQECKISVSDKYLKAEYGDIIVVSRLSETRYVDYTVLEANMSDNWNVKVNRKDLLSKIDVVDFATVRSVRDILFTFAPGNIQLYAHDTFTGKEAESDLPAEHDLTTKIKLNGAQLKSLLNTINEEEIWFNITSPHKTVYLKPEDNDNTLLLIQPLLIED